MLPLQSYTGACRCASVRRTMDHKKGERIGLQELIDNAIEDIDLDQDDSFDPEHMHLAEFSRRTG